MALASLIQLVAVLTNDYTYMKKTNMVGTDFDDIWSVPYCSRLHVKRGITPRLYGSSKDIGEVWDNNKLKYTKQQLNQLSEDVEKGVYANANNFKDFIINNVKPQVNMEIKIFNEVFNIECNRFKWEETTEIVRFIYTSQQSILKKTTKTVNLVPDLNQFKRYFQTLLLS